MLFIVNRWNVADRILYSWMLCVCSGCCWLVILYLSVYPSLLFYVSILPWNRNTVYIECGFITAPRPKQLHSYALIVPICGTNIIGNIRFRIRLCERLWHAYCCCYLCYLRASARQYMTLNGLSKWNFPSTFLAVICWLLLLRRRYMYANGSVLICQDIICYIYYIWFIKFMVYKSNARIFIQFLMCTQKVVHHTFYSSFSILFFVYLLMIESHFFCILFFSRFHTSIDKQVFPPSETVQKSHLISLFRMLMAFSLVIITCVPFSIIHIC